MTRGPTIHVAAARQAGFTFIEVLMALSMLLVGSVAILALFAVGTRSLVQRQVDAKINQVKREALLILQGAFDGAEGGGLPEKIEGHELSASDFTLDATFVPSQFGGDRAVALAVVRYQGTPVRSFFVPLVRSVLVPESGGSG
jgi:type II secretory pathway pseudopilin PulG